jgi:hypothetical protein
MPPIRARPTWRTHYLPILSRRVSRRLASTSSASLYTGAPTLPLDFTGQTVVVRRRPASRPRAYPVSDRRGRYP